MMEIEKLKKTWMSHSERVFDEFVKDYLEDREYFPFLPVCSNLNPVQTFENYKETEENREALKQAIVFVSQIENSSEEDASSNVLLLQGGLGKTYLLNSIGNEYLHRYQDNKVMYVTAGNFCNELIMAIQSGRRIEFNKRYTNCDLLLFDDVEELSGKEITSMEVVHIFDSMYQKKKLIAFSLSGEVSELQIPEKLKRRLQWGENVYLGVNGDGSHLGVNGDGSH